MPISSRRCSAGDIQDLRSSLQNLKGIGQTLDSLDPNRPPSASSAAASDSSLHFLHWETMILSHRVTRTVPRARKERIWTVARQKWRASAALCRRQGKDLRIKLRKHYEASIISTGAKRNIGPKLREMADKITAVMRDIAQDIFSIFYILSRFVWWLLRWPCYVVLTGLLLLQLIALLYTLSSQAFLSAFCQQRLPVVRNWICSNWDQIQSSSQRVSPDSANLNVPLGNVLHSSEQTMSCRLPNHLARYETEVRFFRASLSQSKYPISDQNYFFRAINDFTDKTAETIKVALPFHPHMVGTVSTHVTDTKCVVNRLNDEGFLSRESVSANGTLADGMAWLNSWHLVYLPVGIEPFQQSSAQIQETSSLEVMQEHFDLMRARLRVDIDNATYLQRRLLAIGDLTDDIGRHISIAEARNVKGQFNRQGNRVISWVKKEVYGKTYEIELIEQRRSWLTAMGDEFNDLTAFVAQAARELGSAYDTCQFFSERLAEARFAVHRGHRAPKWVREQALEMHRGIVDLEHKLQSLRSAELRFHGRDFKRGNRESDQPTTSIGQLGS